jgi:hypothetical protein
VKAAAPVLLWLATVCSKQLQLHAVEVLLLPIAIAMMLLAACCAAHLLALLSDGGAVASLQQSPGSLAQCCSAHVAIFFAGVKQSKRIEPTAWVSSSC